MGPREWVKCEQRDTRHQHDSCPERKSDKPLGTVLWNGRSNTYAVKWKKGVKNTAVNRPRSHGNCFDHKVVPVFTLIADGM